MTKRFKCNVKKINHVAGDFIHSYLISFLACTSQCSKHSHFFIYANAFSKYLPTVTFWYSFSMYFFCSDLENWVKITKIISVFFFFFLMEFFFLLFFFFYKLSEI